MVKIINDWEKKAKRIEFEGVSNDDILDELEIICDKLHSPYFENTVISYNNPENVYFTLKKLKDEKVRLLDNSKKRSQYVSEGLKFLVGGSLGFLSYSFLDNRFDFSNSFKDISLIVSLYSGFVFSNLKILNPTKEKIKTLEKSIAKLDFLEDKLIFSETDKFYSKNIAPYFVSENF